MENASGDDPTIEAMASEILARIKSAESIKRQLAGCQETNAALAKDNANLRARLEEMQGIAERSIEARTRLINQGRAEPLAALDAEQKGMLWAALSRQIESLLDSLRIRDELSPGFKPTVQDVLDLCQVHDILFPAGKPESGGGNLAGG